MANADPGVVDQYVDRPHAINGLGKCGLHLGKIGNVGGEHACQAWQFSGDPIASLFAAVQNTDRAAFFKKASGVACPMPLAPPVTRTFLPIRPRMYHP